MNINFITVYRIIILLLLGYLSFQLYVLRREMNDNLREIDMVISKLDYVESDINTRR